MLSYKTMTSDLKTNKNIYVNFFVSFVSRACLIINYIHLIYTHFRFVLINDTFFSVDLFV